MKSFRNLWVAVVVLLASFSAGLAEKVATMPAPTDYVDDYAGVLTLGGKAQIDAICHEVHAKTKAQIFFVTIKSLEGESVDTFANDLFHKWKIGEKKTDRGILVLLSIDDHKRRIEVGYGLEGILTDADAGTIGRAMVPALKDSNYDEAALVGVKAIALAIADDAKVTLNSTAAPVMPPLQDQPPPPVTSAPPSSEINGGGVALIVMFVCFFGVIGLIIWGVIRGNRGSYYSGPRYYNPDPGNTFTTFGGTDSNSSFSSSDSGSSFSGSDSSSSFSSSDSSSSDSFSGGGGGDSGGGGASGDW